MSTTTTLLLWMPLLLSLSEVRCEIGELQGQVKITYQLLYASSTYLEELYNSDKKLVEFTPTNYDSAKATCVSTCSDWNYHGRRCSLFYVGSGTTDNSWKDKCFIANVDYEDVDIVEKGTPDSMEFRFLNVIDGLHKQTP